MKSTKAKATMLVVDMQYELLGLNGHYVDVKQVTLLAANEGGQVFKRTYMYTLHYENLIPEIAESDDMPGEILAFIDENFEKGRVPKLVTADMGKLLRYFQQSAPTVGQRLYGATRVDMRSLVQDLPENSLVYSDFARGRTGQGRTVYDTLSAFLFFRNDI